MPTAWSAERVEELRTLYARGDSASVIAAAIGGGATRNSVIGKIHRLGLEPRGRRVIDDVERERRKQQYRDSNKNALRMRLRRAAARGVAPPVVEEPVVSPTFAGSLRLSIADLRPLGPLANQCRFPEGREPPFFYCGNETLPGESWCGHCDDVVHDLNNRRAFKGGNRRGLKASARMGSFEAA